MAASDESEYVTRAERVSDRELLITRSFRARPMTVFEAMTKAEHIARWFAPKKLGVVVHEIQSDPRVGGKYRWVFGHPGKPPMAFSGVYTEIVPGARVVYTQIFEPMPDAGEGLITMTFEAFEGGTRYRSLERYPSKEVLDGALASGMERGMRETLEQLAELVVELEPRA